MLEEGSKPKQPVIDVVAAAFEYMAVYGQWPRNWRHFVHGSRQIGRDIARTNLTEFNRMQLAQSTNAADVRRFVIRNSILSEWSN